MNSRKLFLGLVLILLSLSSVFNYALAVSLTPPSIQVSLKDTNGDGLRDLVFTAVKEGLGVEGVQINLTAGASQDLTLVSRKTDINGVCTFFSVPGGAYGWAASNGAPSSGQITVPIAEFCLTESEAIAWQTMALGWIGESEDAGQALFEKMSMFVGFDLTGNPFSSPVGSNLMEYSRKTYEWLDELQSYIVCLNRPELSLLSKMIFPFKAVTSGFFIDGAEGISFSQITNVTLQLVLNSSEQFITYAFANIYSNGSVADSVHDILKMPVTSGLDMTLAFPAEMIIAAFQHCYEPRFLNPSALWDSSIRSTDESFPTTCISVLNMSASAVSEALKYLGYARTAVGFLTKFVPAVGSVLQLLGGMVAAVQVFYGVVITLMTVFHWWETYPTLGVFVSNILQGNPVLLTEVAMVAFNILLAVYGAYYLYSLFTGIILGAAYTGVGILLGIIGWLLWWWYQQVKYNESIDILEGDLGNTLTGLFGVREGLRDMNVTSLRQTAGVCERSADVLSRFAQIAHERSSSSGLEQFFSSSSAGLREHAEQETELANAVGNATMSLDELLHDYMSWNGKSGQIGAYLDGYNSTTVTYSRSGEMFTNNAVVGVKDGSNYDYQKKHVTADDLEGNLSLTPKSSVSREEHVWWWTEWHGWAWDYLPKQNDLRDNEFAVFYNINDTNPIVYDKKPSYLDVSYVNVTTPFETFYQYKFQFENGHPSSEVASEWTEYINQASKKFRTDLRRVQYALGAPVYEENATGKPQYGNSWSSTNDPSSVSGQVMKASTFSPNGGCLFGPYINSTSNGESMLGMPYYASFRLKVSSNASASVVASIDVAFNAGLILQSIQVKASDFSRPDTWQSFELPFTAPVSMIAGLEFRVRNSNNGVADLYFDKVSITRGWNSSTLYYEAAYNKRVGGIWHLAWPPWFESSWSTVPDPSSDSGLVMKALGTSPRNDWLYGPYNNTSFDGDSLLGYACVATFRLKVSSNQYNSPVAHIDIAYNAGLILQSMQIKANDFVSSNTWQDFKLTFIAPNTTLSAGLEFRVQNLNNGITDLFVDGITIVRWGNSSVKFAEGAINKYRRQGDVSWQSVSDSSSFSGLVMEASSSSSNYGWLYGPYITTDMNGHSLLDKPYTATFRLKVASNLSSSEAVSIDVCCNFDTVLGALSIKASDFLSPNTWQDFQLIFIVPSSVRVGLEFRVQNRNNGVTDVFVDYIRVGRSSELNFVVDCYRDLFFRDPEPEGLEFWASELESGRLTRVSFVEAIFSSQEYQGKWKNRLFVALMYGGVLERGPDQGGYNYYVTALDSSSTTWHAMLDSWLKSTEWNVRFGSLNDTEFVRKMYRSMLHREPDQEGLDFWAMKLTMHELTRPELLIRLFMESPEYRMVNAGERLVYQLYLGLLGRVPDPEGYKNWVSIFNSGTPRQDMIQTFLTCSEYCTKHS